MADINNKGTKVYIKFNDTDWTEVTNIESFSGPNLSIDHYPVSYLSDDWMTKRPTVKDAGQINLTIGYDPANASHTSLFTMFGAGATHAVKVELSDVSDTSPTSDGFVKEFTFPGGTSKDQCKVDVVIELTGELTFE